MVMPAAMAAAAKIAIRMMIQINHRTRLRHTLQAGI
jgi:hypothetical protein